MAIFSSSRRRSLPAARVRATRSGIGEAVLSWLVFLAMVVGGHLFVMAMSRG